MIDSSRYPIGQQDFKTLRNRNLLYVDKTKYIKAEVHTSDGRMDLLIETPNFIYIIRLIFGN